MAWSTWLPGWHRVKGPLLCAPKCKTKTRTTVFSVCAPSLWNKLPLCIRSSESRTCFRQHLRTHLLHLVYPPQLLDFPIDLLMMNTAFLWTYVFSLIFFGLKCLWTCMATPKDTDAIKVLSIVLYCIVLYCTVLYCIVTHHPGTAWHTVKALPLTCLQSGIT